jgi:hypothetical protein
MDHQIILRLLQNKTEEIQSLLEHFKHHSNDLENGLNLLSDRIESLSKEFVLMKDILSNQIPQNKNSEATPVADEKHLEPENLRLTNSEPIALPINDNNVKIDSDSTLNDQLQTKSNKIIGEKLFNGKLSDIQSAIGINDRFLFIRELFANNSDSYNECIRFINQSDSYSAIENHLKQTTEWDFENPTVIQFLELTKRKF